MKYDATYPSRRGKAITHIVAPSPVSDEQKAKLLAEFHSAARAGWNALPAEDRRKINAEFANGQPR